MKLKLSSLAALIASGLVSTSARTADFAADPLTKKSLSIDMSEGIDTSGSTGSVANEGGGDTGEQQQGQTADDSPGAQMQAQVDGSKQQSDESPGAASSQAAKSADPTLASPTIKPPIGDAQGQSQQT